MAEQELRQPQVVLRALELGRGRVPPSLEHLPRDEDRHFKLVLPLAESLVESGKLEDAERPLSTAAVDARGRGLETLAFAVELEQERRRMLMDPGWSTESALGLVERALPALETVSVGSR
jgi:hypothetical protein